MLNIELTHFHLISQMEMSLIGQMEISKSCGYSQSETRLHFFFYSWYYSLIHYSQYSRSFVSEPCAPSGKYLQSSSGDLKDTSLFYTMSRSSYREVFPTPSGSCFYQLLNYLHWTPVANINCSDYFVIFCHYLICHGHYWWEFVSIKDSVSWTVSEMRLNQICLTY